jgi:hypothetical protein
MTLGELVEKAMTRHGAASGAALARVATANGLHIVPTTINHIRAGTYRPKPKATTLKAIAFLAGVPVNVAYEAAGLPSRGKPFAEELPDDSDLMTPKQRDVVIRMIRALLDT